MVSVKAYATKSAGSQLEPFTFTRRKLGDHDVLLKIAYCGVCHSDVHQARNEWGGSIYPMVPGHEIVGEVVEVGKAVQRVRRGDLGGVGCFVDSCRRCDPCKKSEQQFCEVHTAQTYNSTEMDLKTPTYGGYSSHIVIDEEYMLKVPKNLPLEQVAPLLCAGITTYSPLKYWSIGKGHRVAVLGLGGLGHMAVKLAAAMGADVTVLSSSPHKEADARRLGANHFAVTSHATESLQNQFHFIINTVSAPHDLNLYLQFLKTDGTMILLGAPPEGPRLETSLLVLRRRKIAGSLIGGIAQTQEMLDFCAEKNIASDVEVIAIKQINTAYERLMRSDVKYRFVIDMKTLD